MADDNFRSYRSRDPLLRNEAASDPSDPLAELARLIGQSGPYPDSRRPEAYSPAQADDEVEAPTDEWTADADYADEPAEEPYDPSLTAPQSPASYQSSPTPDRAYESEPPPGGRYFSGSAAEFGGFREEPAAEYRNDHVPALRPREVPAYATAETEEDYADEQPQEGGESYASDGYYDEPPAPRRRGAVGVVMAVLSLAVIGTAGAFGYRTMFGG